MLPFFVYGTLKRGEPNYERLLRDRTLAEEDAVLEPAAMYTAGPYPFLVTAADLLPTPQAQVSGQLMTIHPELYDQTLQQLDELEEYDPADPRSMYLRRDISVTCAGQPRRAWIYVAGTQIEASIRHGRLELIRDGNWRAPTTRP
jgi:gamma-glutamylcyclotransferase (GGCT)/AIG2-like uncharacterized protein YtfP